MKLRSEIVGELERIALFIKKDIISVNTGMAHLRAFVKQTDKEEGVKEDDKKELSEYCDQISSEYFNISHAPALKCLSRKGLDEAEWAYKKYMSSIVMRHLEKIIEIYCNKGKTNG